MASLQTAIIFSQTPVRHVLDKVKRRSESLKITMSPMLILRRLTICQEQLGGTTWVLSQTTNVSQKTSHFVLILIIWDTIIFHFLDRTIAHIDSSSVYQQLAAWQSWARSLLKEIVLESVLSTCQSLISLLLMLESSKVAPPRNTLWDCVIVIPVPAVTSSNKADLDHYFQSSPSRRDGLKLSLLLQRSSPV